MTRSDLQQLVHGMTKPQASAAVRAYFQLDNTSMADARVYGDTPRQMTVDEVVTALMEEV